MEENKQQMPQFNGWKDAKIDGNMPIQGLIEFLNILNQRLILIEDQLTIKVGEGQNITLTQYWIEVQKQEYQRMMEEYQKQMEAQKAQAQANEQSQDQAPSDVQ